MRLILQDFFIFIFTLLHSATVALIFILRFLHSKLLQDLHSSSFTYLHSTTSVTVALYFVLQNSTQVPHHWRNKREVRRRAQREEELEVRKRAKNTIPAHFEACNRWLIAIFSDFVRRRLNIGRSIQSWGSKVVRVVVLHAFFICSEALGIKHGKSGCKDEAEREAKASFDEPPKCNNERMRAWPWRSSGSNTMVRSNWIFIFCISVFLPCCTHEEFWIGSP